jgi:hypothetical protein
VVCDLPAARKVAGLAAFNTSRKFCSHCSHNGKGSDGQVAYGLSDHPAFQREARLCGISNLEISQTSGQFMEEVENEEELKEVRNEIITLLASMNGSNTDEMIQQIIEYLAPIPEPTGWAQWPSRYLQLQAWVWKHLPSNSLRDVLWSRFGVRDSELWRLPDWNPIVQLVPDPMHCFLEGVVQHHFREILHLSEEYKIKPEHTFSLDIELDDGNLLDVIAETDPGAKFDKVKSNARLIIKRLTESVDAQATAEDDLKEALSNYNKVSIWFITKRVGLLSENEKYKQCSRAYMLSKLVQWVSTHPKPGELS